MPAWIAIVLIAAASFLMGWFILRQLITGKRSFQGSLSELLFASLTLGVIAIGTIAFVLAEFGWFSIPLLIVLWIGVLIALALRTPQRPFWTLPRLATPPRHHLIPFLPHWVEYLTLGIWIIAAIWLFFRPHQFIIGGADAGVYVNLGAEIARNGSILIQDDFLASLPTELYPAFLRPQNNAIAPFYILPAFFVVGDPIGEITPQFYHLHPVWLALANGLAGGGDSGVQAELMMPGLWALLGSLAIYFTVRRIAGRETALLTLAGLSLNALQVWFARYPTTETLTQFLLWAGLWSLGVWVENPRSRPFWGLLAGLALGQTFLIRIDMLFILPLLGLFGVWLWARDGWKQTYNWFFLPLLLLVLHSLLHALWQSRPYFFDLFGFAITLLAVNWYIPVGAAIGSIALLLGLGRYRRQFNRLGRFQQQFLMSLVFIFVVWALYSWFVRPYLGETVLWNDPYSKTAVPQLNHENLIRFGWYLSPGGIWLGVAGIGLLIWQVNRKTAVMLSTSLLLSFIYLINIRANPHQIYAMRRYVPAVMPIFIIGAANFIGWLAARRNSWLSGAAILLILAWLGGLAWSARGFISQVDYPGILPQIDQFADQLPSDSILIFNDPSPIGQGDTIGTPLRFLKRHNVLTLRVPEALDKQLLSQSLHHWQEQGSAIYWINVPNGYDWPLSDWTISEAGTYNIRTSALEGTYDRRPSQIIELRWQGQIMIVTPAP